MAIGAIRAYLLTADVAFKKEFEEELVLRDGVGVDERQLREGVRAGSEDGCELFGVDRQGAPTLRHPLG